MLPTKFRVNCPFGSGEKDFHGGHHGRNLGFPIATKKKRKTDFQDGCHGGHFGFSIGTILAIFDLCHPDASYQVWSQLAFGFRSRSEK